MPQVTLTLKEYKNIEKGVCQLVEFIFDKNEKIRDLKEEIKQLERAIGIDRTERFIYGR
ncbi:hypothetical protein [Alkalicoccobacillus gibsonii]|uniref:hypothetical protein n=1 Tax=Alkalicoccobacillus gibsonii TaxID=79881 RepID=UPI001931DA08|nr:hypothetical protein [Alkalicoccobacillus gibsonii]MBM0064765.1 hypothetical protein [Alkalicoccobacillus gibsonii]